MAANVAQQPTEAEVDALERVLSDAHSQPCDGYWREIARAGLEAAKAVEMNGFVALIDREIRLAEGAIAAHRGQLGLNRMSSPEPIAEAGWDELLGGSRC